MNKYLKRGLWGVGVIALFSLAIFFVMSYTYNRYNLDIVADFLYLFLSFIAWPFFLFDESLFRFILGISLTFIYWLVLGNIIGFLIEKITKFLKK